MCSDSTASRSITKNWAAAILALVTAGCAALLLPAVAGPVWAQTGRTKTSRTSANVRSIDIKTQRLEESFVREAAQLAKEYADAGQLEKSRDVLQTILNVDPSLKGVREKIKEIDNSILEANSYQFELDTSRGWGRPAGQVVKGKKFRIKASGSYQFVVNRTVDVNGFPTEGDPTAIMPKDIPCGALMGMVVAPGKAGKPFLVQQGCEHTPKEDGHLFLRVNDPPGAESTGTLMIELSGAITEVR